MRCAEEELEHRQNPLIDSSLAVNNEDVTHSRMFSAAHHAEAVVILLLLLLLCSGRITYCSAARRMWEL